jgi:hypothetical protein
MFNQCAYWRVIFATLTFLEGIVLLFKPFMIIDVGKHRLPLALFNCDKSSTLAF